MQPQHLTRCRPVFVSLDTRCFLFMIYVYFFKYLMSSSKETREECQETFQFKEMIAV